MRNSYHDISNECRLPITDISWRSQKNKCFFFFGAVVVVVKASYLELCMTYKAEVLYFRMSI